MLLLGPTMYGDPVYVCVCTLATRGLTATLTCIWGLVRWIAFAPSMSTLCAVALPHEHLTYPPLYHLLQRLHCDGNLGGGYLFCICQVVLLYVLFCTFENGKISRLRQLANWGERRGRAAAFISVGPVLR